ncbi:MAG: hypothetical protein IJZ59_07325 [Alphaproteobacteria bacterium]|nr:hypothetical protein [Alphaproteobacteria bacterium]
MFLLGDVVGWHAAFVKFLVSPRIRKGTDNQPVVIIDAHQTDFSGIISVA